MKSYTDILKELRKEKGLTQEEIGKSFGMSQRMYSFYESGQREMKIDMLIRLADILNTSTDYILGRTIIKEPFPPRNKSRRNTREFIE